MANPEHVEILNQGPDVWNAWKRLNPNPDLSNSFLQSYALSAVDFSGVNLRGADLSYSEFINANFAFSDLRGANLTHTVFRVASFLGAQLGGAKLSHTILALADLTDVKLEGADFSNAVLHGAVFGNNDLRGVKGLENVNHQAPSTVGVDTIYRSQGKIPEIFLRGCGLHESFVQQTPALVAAMQPIQFYSCFISYSHKDEDFARRLYSRMGEAGLRVWYAPEDIQGGRKLHEQIFGAIHVHDKLLLVLSENGLRSEWVATEIRRARKAEGEEGRRKLFPIRLVDFEAIRAWECFDADTGKDLGVELREYFIPDFSDWKDHNAFEKAFERLLRDLKAEEPAKPTYMAPDRLENRAMLSPRDTIREGWKGVESSVSQAAMRNGLVSEGERVNCGLLINQLHEAGEISDGVREEYFLLSKWHRSVDFDSFSSVEPQTAINFVNRARELQKAMAVDTPPRR